MYFNKSPSLFKNINVIGLIPKRNKGKRNKHSSKLKKEPTDRALEHFDKYHAPIYGKLWPSIRLALLSPRKYCALVNNYANASEAVSNLTSDGAENILKIAEDTDCSNHSISDLLSTSPASEDNIDVEVISDRQGSIMDIVESKDVESDLYNFMPTRRVASEIEQLKLEEDRQQTEYSSRKSRSNDSSACQVIPDADLKFPYHLKAYAFERGNCGTFPHPKMDSSGNTDCYMYDAASILPVVALDLDPYCNVLDLCAAPGGKSLTMLQTMLPDSITCVDSVFSRLERLRMTMKQYVPVRYGQGELVSTLCRDGTQLWKKIPDDARYDRVLVDAPCYTDRHVLSDPDNNLFRPGRLEDRIRLPKLQKQLLFSGLQACRPGGTVVYSTCTLSPVQNDGVVEATLQRIYQETDVEVAVVDTQHVAERFREIFNFYRDCRYGQLVIPNVTANFGPMYFCKLKRIK